MNHQFGVPKENSKLHKVDGQQPTNELRLDTIDHLPDFDSFKNATKCKLRTCTRITHIFCSKYRKHLYLDGKSQCLR